MRCIVVALAFLLAPTIAYAKKTDVRLFCGLGQGDWCALNALAQKIRASGYKASVYSHWTHPDAVMKAGDVAIGHSRGADSVVASRKPRRVFSIDATVANRGALLGKRVTNFYNPMNRVFPFGWLTFGICCGGAQVAGAENVVWRQMHVAISGDPVLHNRIVKEVVKFP